MDSLLYYIKEFNKKRKHEKLSQIFEKVISNIAIVIIQINIARLIIDIILEMNIESYFHYQQEEF